MPEKNRTYKKLAARLDDRSGKHRLRSLYPLTYRMGKDRVYIGSSEFLNFCSNDYLGLSGHPDLINRSNEFTYTFGTSSSASRLVSGSMEIHHNLETKIADRYGSESALLFGNGFMANSTILPALTDRNDLILADKQCHNSILQGGLTSRADFKRFRHNDLKHLEELLARYSGREDRDCWVVTESLFSMSGDLAPLDDIVELCSNFDVYLMVDDAHAFGVYGKQGLGLTEGRNDIDIVLGTMGKAGGCYGAFVLSSSLLRDALINYCPGLIYTTAPPPGNIGAIDAAFDLIPGLNSERESLFDHVRYLHEQLLRTGIKTGQTRSQIIPVYTNDDQHALKVSDHLFKEKIFVQAIRPPTVENSLLRITLSALHSKRDIDKLIEGIRNGW